MCIYGLFGFTYENVISAEPNLTDFDLILKLFPAMAEKNGVSAPAILSPNQEHCCEICGVAGLSDDSMREHTKTCHIDGNALCPFCGLSGVAPAELLLHVNQAHLDYLTPENELMSFIDDQSPR